MMWASSGSRFVASTLVCAALLLAGCEEAKKPIVDPAGPEKAGTAAKPAVEEVTLQLNWTPETEHGGFYAALVHGYYEEAGLKVEIRPGGPAAPVGPMVAGGQVTFGIDNADKMLNFRSQGADLVALFASLQTSPRCLIIHDDSPIKSFDDLQGITLAMGNQPWVEFLKKKLPLKDVKFVPNPAGLAQFLNDKNFVQQGYIFSEPLSVAEQGGKARSLLVSELGYNPYTSLLIAKGTLVKEKPELMKRMVAASLKGWQKYLEDPIAANEAIHKANELMSLQVLQDGVEAMKPLCFGDDTDPAKLGRMTAERWKTLTDQLVEIGAIKEGSVDPASAFTTEFLK
jgi:NitT/TauT family transport system substrate-binding protein